jgi:hypothetical protein
MGQSKPEMHARQIGDWQSDNRLPKDFLMFTACRWRLPRETPIARHIGVSGAAGAGEREA